MDIQKMINDAVNRRVQELIEERVRSAVEKALQPTEQGDIEKVLQVARQVSGIDLPPITNVQPLNQPTTQVITNPPKPVVPLQHTLPLGRNWKTYVKRSHYRHFAAPNSYLSVTNKKFKMRGNGTYIANVYAMCSELLSGGPATRRDLHLLIHEQMPDLNESTLSSCLTKFVASKHLIVVPDPSVAKGF